MNILILLPLIVGAIVGGIAVLTLFYLGYRKQIKIGEGRKMGLNLSTGNRCPSCERPLPTFRRPKNFRQMMWGGWTCEACGTEFDKWLKPIQRK